MKKFIRINYFALITFFAIIGTSCNNDSNNTNPVDNSISGIASKTANLSILVQALNKVDLATTLKSSGTYTVFAPTNEAFTTFLATTPYATINDVPNAVLKEILLNHVIGSVVKSTNLSTGYIKTLGKWAEGATYIKINTYEHKRSLPFINEALSAKIIRTDGEKGSFFRGKAFPVEKVEVKDSSGAGDTFMAALVVNFLSSQDIEQSIGFANQCAAKIVARRGVSII